MIAVNELKVKLRLKAWRATAETKSAVAVRSARACSLDD